MNDKFISNNIESDELPLNTQESDYKNLVNKLKEISSIIALLGNRSLDKF